METRFDLDPTPLKAAAIAVLLFVDTFMAALGSSVLLGSMPTEPQLIAYAVAASSATTTYLLGFLGYGKEEATT
jgi:hypothetical protein